MKTKEKSSAASTSKKSSKGRVKKDEQAKVQLDEELLPDEEHDEENDSSLDLSEDELLEHGSDSESLLDAPLSLEFESDDDSPKALPFEEFDGKNLPSVHTSNSIKIRDNLQLYLQEISRFPMLKPDEEVNLARLVRDHNDPDAAFRLISSHLRLVVRIAMDFQRRWMQNVLDLIQEGNVGLVRAVSKFDPEKGIKFSYYAAFWIKAYILKFIMDNWRMVKIGTTQAQRKLFYNLNKERQRLIAQGFDPDAAMLSKNLNVTEDEIVEMQQRMDASDMSLNLPVNTDEPGGSSRMDYLPALGPGIEDILADQQVASMVQEQLKTLIPSLSDKEKYILEQRLLTDDPITLREIGEKYNITRERVRQIEARLLQKIRDHLFKNITDFSHDWVSQE